MFQIGAESRLDARPQPASSGNGHERRGAALARAGRYLLRAFLNWCSDRPEYREQVHADACAPRLGKETLPKPSARDDCLQKEQIQGHKPSATREKHYKKRPLDLLRMWHTKIEARVLEQAGIEQPSEGQASGLRVVQA